MHFPSKTSIPVHNNGYMPRYPPCLEDPTAQRTRPATGPGTLPRFVSSLAHRSGVLVRLLFQAPPSSQFSFVSARICSNGTGNILRDSSVIAAVACYEDEDRTVQCLLFSDFVMLDLLPAVSFHDSYSLHVTIVK